MNKSSDKEKWVNEVLSSTEGMKKAEANPFLYEKIIYKLQHRETVQDIPAKVLLPKWILAGVVILLLNSLVLVKEMNRGKNIRNTDTQGMGMLSELGNQTTYNY